MKAPFGQRLAKQALLALAVFVGLELALRAAYAIFLPESVLEERSLHWIGELEVIDGKGRGLLAPWERRHQLTRYDDTDLLWRLAPDKRRRFGFGGGNRQDVFTNSEGFYSPEFFPEKREDGLRIVCMGSSFSFLGYPRQLENVLQWLYPEAGFEVINCATPGYTTFQNRALFDKRVSGYTFDLAVLAVGGNDYNSKAARPDSQQRASARLRELRANLKLLELVQYGVDLVRSRGTGDAPGEGAELGARVSPAEFEDNVGYLLRELRARTRGPVVLVVVNPVPDEYVPGLQRALAGTDTVVLEATLEVSDLLGEAGWQEHFQRHPDQLGNKALALTVYRKLTRMPAFREHVGRPPIPADAVWTR